MKNIEKLRRVGLRPTKQRLLIADLLLNGHNRHFSAEDLQDEITSSGNYMSFRHDSNESRFKSSRDC